MDRVRNHRWSTGTCRKTKDTDNNTAYETKTEKMSYSSTNLRPVTPRLVTSEVNGGRMEGRNNLAGQGKSYWTSWQKTTQNVLFTAKENDRRQNWRASISIGPEKEDKQTDSNMFTTRRWLLNPFTADPVKALHFAISNFWHSGALALSTERRSTRMSKIRNGGLDQYSAEPFEQQQFGTAGV